MNKRKINSLVQAAYEKLNESDVGLVKDGKLPRVCRSNIASFGAAITTGSLLAAVSSLQNDAYDSKSDEKKASIVNKKSKDKKGKILCEIMWSLLKENCNLPKSSNIKGDQTFVEYLMSFDLDKDYNEFMKVRAELKEIVVAMKLSMNFFELVEEDREKV